MKRAKLVEFMEKEMDKGCDDNLILQKSYLLLENEQRGHLA